MSRLTHLDEQGAARMVDVGAKNVTERVAVAGATVRMLPQTLALIDQGGHAKGDVLAVARIAGIQAAKQTSSLIPLCHPLMLNAVDVNFEFDHEASALQVEASCRVSGKTGVEMEALTAVSVAALTIYDMCKAVDRGMRITDVELRSKSGGKSGDWQREAGDGAC
ncbi:MAG: cyclic pyranopterin monophosphate synthase MoaC [Halioglobus sp.]|nr:cyclic pyranopterin monophosphate synthase MoaC [Halioglobus sp.]